jgi:hypothetical protein
MRHALAPGGRAAIAVWQGLEHQSLFAAITEVEARYLGPLGVSYDDLVAPFSLGDAALMESLLDGAGFRSIDVVPRTVQARFPSPDTFVRNVEIGYAAVVPQFAEDPAAFAAYVDAVEAETRELVERHRHGDVLSFPLRAHVALAVSPAA